MFGVGDIVLTANDAQLFFPVYWLTQTQMSNNFVSQAGQMQRYAGSTHAYNSWMILLKLTGRPPASHNIPNDIMINLDPICIIVMIPVCDKFVFPFLHRVGFTGPINKIFVR